jgi:hypothetical protein
VNIDLIAGRKKREREPRNEVGKASGEFDEAEESST